jgi:hypothetical protein
MLIAKSLVAISVLWAHTGDAQPDSLDVVVDVANRAGLFGAARREVGWIEIQTCNRSVSDDSPPWSFSNTNSGAFDPDCSI